MANKKTKKENTKPVSEEKQQYTQEELEFARINLRKNFNERFSKWAVMEPEDADDDFIAQAKKDLEDAVEDQKKKTYNIGDAADGIALKTAEFLKEWNEKFNYWEKGSWRGLIRFNVVISEIIEKLKADDKMNLDIDYQTLIFLYNSMMNPSGIGLDTARQMAIFENYNEETDAPFEENIPVTYSGVLSKIIEHINYLGGIDKKLNILRTRLQYAYMGLKMTLKVTEIEEFVEFNDAVTDNGVAEATEEEIPDPDKN